MQAPPVSLPAHYHRLTAAVDGHFLLVQRREDARTQLRLRKDAPLKTDLSESLKWYHSSVSLIAHLQASQQALLLQCGRYNLRAG